MAIIWNQKVKVIWNPANRKYYDEILNEEGLKKYQFSKYKSVFEADIKDINKSSNTLIRCICDRCNEEYSVSFSQANKSKNNYCSKQCKNNTQKHSCDNCGIEKNIPFYRKEALINGKQKNFFCSRKCQGEWQAKNKSGENSPLYNQHDTECEYCGKAYTIPSNRLDRNKYCSVECKRKSTMSRIEMNCDYCEKTIYKTPYELTKTSNYFCSHKCANTYRSEQAYEKRKCEYCSNDYTTKKVARQRFCSTRCQSKWQSEYLIGERANNFKANLPLKNRVIKCDWCKDSFNARSPYQYRMVASGEQRNVFCSKECRQNWYSSVFSQSEEWKEKSRIDAVRILESGVVKTTASECQLMVNTILDGLEVKYENEYNCKYFSMDNYLKDYNLMIEVMGTFWHCDPRVYDTIRYNQQADAIIQDKRKNSYIKSQYGINILYLWEQDIFDHPEMIEKLILLYITSNGKLLNYNSFNYFISDEKIYLNDNIIKPYMDYSAEDRNKIIDIKLKDNRSKKQEDKWTTFNCDNCGEKKEMLTSRYTKRKNHYCGRDCMYEHRRIKI